ncbi:MAG: UDP-3-O-[Synergistaceae bacterium]|nr:UDP-3-O-[3-hydroxymyristoyl] N-acetylglucosamine deacetylase [Synergistaceae bacterium]
MRLTSKLKFSGLGLHSGKECQVELEPCGAPEVLISDYPLRLLKTEGTNRGSDYIFPDGTKIRTFEHLLSALAGLEIFSGVRVSVEGGEIPAIDGSAESFCAEILKNSENCEPVSPVEISEPLIVSNADKTRFVAAFPDSDGLRITYSVEYNYVGAYIFDYVQSPENYVREISRARTFAMKSDVDYLRSHGMALGGSLDNAILIDENEIHAKGGLRWENELVRHKVLDLIGDLASIGRPLKAHVIAMRAGHELHLKFAEKLKELKEQKGAK